jgi:hypothetical protein
MRSLMQTSVLLLVLALGSSIAEERTKPVGITAKQLWKSIKTELMGPDGQKYFEESIKNAMVPGGAGGVTMFTGTLLSAEPSEQPHVLVVALSDGTTPEATLCLKDADWNDTHIAGPLMRGSSIQFEGVPTSFTKEPFMVTFEVSMNKRSQPIQGSKH